MTKTILPPSGSMDFWLYAAGKNTKHFNSTSTTGKWCIFPEEDDEVDALWNAITHLADEGKIVLAKTSTALTRFRHKSYVICVYTHDWKDESDVMSIRDVLRAAGIEHTLKYKRDSDTFNGVYGTSEEFIYTDTVWPFQ